jgi:hypothetical protein
MRKISKWLFLSAVIGLALITTFGKIASDYWHLREPLGAKRTTARMTWLMGVLDVEQPRHLDPYSLRQILAKYNRLDCQKDAWGRPFLIEHHEQAGDRVRYVVVSLGRDGKRGGCCKKWVANWDDDAVLSGNEWLQVWYPKGAQIQAGAKSVRPPQK